MENEIRNFNIDVFNFMDNIDYKVTLFNTFMAHLINKYMPGPSKVIKRPTAPWITDGIKYIIKRRNRLYIIHA